MKQVVAIMAIVFALASASYAGNVSKAKDFIKAGMYPQAIELLDKEIQENPTNAEAHFELGSCYVIQGRYGDADARFASAVRLKSDYGYKIGGIYKTAGLVAMDKGQTNEAITLLNKAITFQPDLESALITDMMSKGKAAVQQGKYGPADVRFAVASNLDQSARKEACDTYATLGDAAADKKCLTFYQKAAPYCGTNEKIGNRLLTIAKEQARKTNAENEVIQYKNAASQFLGNKTVEAAMPSMVVYQPREEPYKFHVKAGERVDHVIAFPDGFSVHCSIDETPNSKYTIVFQDGRVFGQNDPLPRELSPKFWFVASTDSDITMVVKKK